MSDPTMAYLRNNRKVDLVWGTSQPLPLIHKAHTRIMITIHKTKN